MVHEDTQTNTIAYSVSSIRKYLYLYLSNISLDLYQLCDAAVT